jgi:hypothetical protein
MKKTRLYPLGQGLPLPLGLLMLFAVLALWSVEVLAQDTTLARMPRVELIPVQQYEVMGHHINKLQTPQGWQLEVFSRNRESVLTFGEHDLIEVSPNQQYYTLAKPVTSTNGETDGYEIMRKTVAYDVELRNLDNVILAKGQIPALYSEEAHDAFIPAEDGSGLIQKRDGTFGGLNFVVFQRQQARLMKRFRVDKSDYYNGQVWYEPAQQMIVTACEGIRVADTSAYKAAFIECYTSNGTLQWETAIDSQHLESVLFVSAFDGTVAFVTSHLRDRSHNNLYLFTKNGRLIRQIPVHHIGSYERANFRLIKGRQYFLSSSGVGSYYIVDTENGDIINDQTQAKQDTRVMGLFTYQELIVTTYYTLYTRPGPNNTKEPAPKEQGLGIIDLHGRITYVPLNLTGYPFLLSTKSGLFLREQIGFSLNAQNNFFKIEIK